MERIYVIEQHGKCSHLKTQDSEAVKARRSFSSEMSSTYVRDTCCCSSFSPACNNPLFSTVVYASIRSKDILKLKEFKLSNHPSRQNVIQLDTITDDLEFAN